MLCNGQQSSHLNLANWQIERDGTHYSFDMPLLVAFQLQFNNPRKITSKNILIINYRDNRKCVFECLDYFTPLLALRNELCKFVVTCIKM